MVMSCIRGISALSRSYMATVFDYPGNLGIGLHLGHNCWLPVSRAEYEWSLELLVELSRAIISYVLDSHHDLEEAW